MTQYYVSKDLKKYMETHHKSSIKIHSIFKDAVNLIGEEEELITLLSMYKDIAPMSATLPVTDFKVHALSEGDSVEIDGLFLTFSKTGMTLDLQGHDVWNPAPLKKSRVLGDDKLQQETEKLRSILLKDGQLSGIVALIEKLDFHSKEGVSLVSAEPLNQYAEFIEERMVGFLNALYEKNFNFIERMIPKFVGFGQGLTPSTDDFLLGIMVSMVYEAKSRGMPVKTVSQRTTQIYREAAGRTTKVSEAMLKQGAQGKVANSYRAAVQAMFYDVKPPLEKLCRAVLQNGSTSGTDFLFGVYCYSQLRLKWIEKEADK